MKERKVREACAIEERKPAMNRDEGVDKSSNASGSQTFHPKLFETSSVVEQRTGNKLHLLYKTTLTLTLSANAKNK